MDQDTTEPKGNFAYNCVNEVYDKAIAAEQPKQQAYAEATDAGGDSLQNYTNDLADNTLKPLIESNNITPVQASVAKEQIGLKEPKMDQIIDGRYSESGQYQIGKLEKKFNAMKHLYEDVMFAGTNQKENIEAILQDYLQREVITQEEADLFSRVRSNLIEKKDGADIESIFLAINDNTNRIGYLKRELGSGRVNADIIKNLITEYKLPLSNTDRDQFGI